jgi:RES domain-containing protein
MNNYAASGATFDYVPTDGGTINVNGYVFRAIPHSSQDPLSTAFSYAAGGRWNAAGTAAVLYTAGTIATARAFVNWQASYYGWDWSDRPPEEQPDLLVLQVNGSYADVATNSGLAFYNLPSTYPVGYLAPETWSITQPIGEVIYNAGWPGLVTRSASLDDWSGQISQWAELVLFPERGSPLVVDRITYLDWYPV